MGLQFPASAANLVAYLTYPPAKEPPRLDKERLVDFLEMLTWEKDRFVSSDENWHREIAEAASKGTEQLRGVHVDRFLDSKVISAILAPLREQFARYEFYGLGIDFRWDSGELRGFLKEAAVKSEHRGLFLLTDEVMGKRAELLDPFPPMAKVAQQLDGPLVVFWLPDGESKAVPLSDARDLFGMLNNSEPENHKRILREFRDSRSDTRTILQLSDLHFGTEQAGRNAPYVLTHLIRHFRKVDRLVITGDMFHTPEDEFYQLFKLFLAGLGGHLKSPPIVVPGNHDSRWLGNSLHGFGTKLKQVADLEWSNLVVDEQTRVVFACFDSNRRGDYAEGEVTVDQLLELGRAIEDRARMPDHAQNFMRIALIHHHPFTYEPKKEGWLQRRAERFEERVLRLRDGPEFVEWCARRDFPLILHGHKHIARRYRENVVYDDGRVREIEAVGCGTTLGAEDKPLSYNIISWNPDTRQWSVTVMSDPGDGSGFTPQAIAIRSAA